MVGEVYSQCTGSQAAGGKVLEGNHYQDPLRDGQFSDVRR